MRRWWRKLSELRTKWAAGRYFEKQTQNTLRSRRNAEELDQVEKGVRRRIPPMGPH